MFITTKHIKLIPYSAYYASQLNTWYLDKSYEGFFRQNNFIYTESDFHNYPKILGGTVFIAIEKETGSIVGLAQITPDHKKNGGFYAGLLIDKAFQGNHYTTDIFVILLDFAFNIANYRKCIIEILATNKTLKKILETTGFIKEGLFIGECYINGQYEDEIRYVLFKEQYQQTAAFSLELREKWADSEKV